MTQQGDSPEFFAQGERVGVLTAQPLDRLLDYRAPEGGCFLGAFVEVPLGPRKVVGVVWGPGAGDFDAAKLRSVIRVLDLAPMRAEMRSFLERAAQYTLTPMSMMLRLATRAPGLADPPSMRKVLRRGDDIEIGDARFQRALRNGRFLHQQIVRRILTVPTGNAKPGRGISLRIQVDQQCSPAGRRDRGRDVDRGGGLAHAALLVGNCDADHCLLPPLGRPLPTRIAASRLVSDCST